jgi:hypothetical protein
MIDKVQFNILGYNYTQYSETFRVSTKDCSCCCTYVKLFLEAMYAGTIMVHTGL